VGLGLRTEALASYTEALARQPDHPVTHNNLAVAYRAMGEEQVALRHWHRAAELDPYYAAPRRNLGIVHAKAGRYAEAIQALEQVLALEPTQADVYFKIAQAYHYGLGQPEQALRYWEGGIGYAAGDADAYLQLIRAYGALGQVEPLRRWIDRFATLFPEHPQRVALQRLRGGIIAVQRRPAFAGATLFFHHRHLDSRFRLERSRTLSGASSTLRISAPCRSSAGLSIDNLLKGQ